MATTTNISAADSLNNDFEALGKRFDDFFSQIPKTSKTTIQKVLSDWQDFYYAEENYGKNPNVARWDTIYENTNGLLNKSIAERHLKPKKAKPAKVKEVITIKEPTVVYAKPSFKALLALIGSGFAIGGIGYAISKGKIAYK